MALTSSAMRYGGVGGVRVVGCHDGASGFRYLFLSGAELS